MSAGCPRTCSQTRDRYLHGAFHKEQTLSNKQITQGLRNAVLSQIKGLSTDELLRGITPIRQDPP